MGTIPANRWEPNRKTEPENPTEKPNRKTEPKNRTEKPSRKPLSGNNDHGLFSCGFPPITLPCKSGDDIHQKRLGVYGRMKPHNLRPSASTMAQPGREASTPWGESAEVGSASSDTTPSAVQPIVLGGAAGLSVNSEMQGHMPMQLAPAEGVTLTGQVGTIDSSVWAAQQALQNNGSFLKGMLITIIFGFFIIFVPMMVGGWSDSNYSYGTEENLAITWNAERTNGTFQLSETPIEECTLSIYESGSSRWEETGVNIDACQNGELTQNRNELRITFKMVNETEGEYTYLPSDFDESGDTITLAIIFWEYRQVRKLVGSQELGEGLEPLKFTVNTSDWESCEMEVEINHPRGATNMWPRTTRWGEPPDCPSASYYEYRRITVGNIDLKSGFGELYLSEPLDEDVGLVANYYPGGANGGPSAYEVAPCFGVFVGLVLFIIWIAKIVQSFQSGLTNQGTGMLVGIIPALFVSLISVFIISILIWGF